MKMSYTDEQLVLNQIAKVLAARHTGEGPDITDVNRIMFTKKEWAAINVLRDSAASSLGYVNYVVLQPENFGIDADSAKLSPFSNFTHIELLVTNYCHPSGTRTEIMRPPRRDKYPQPTPTRSDISSTKVLNVHADNRAYNRVKRWAQHETRTSVENIITWNMVETVISGASTWLQLKKWWPQLLQFVVANIRLQNAPTCDLKALDATRAANPPSDMMKAISEYGRFAAGKLLQGHMVRYSGAVKGPAAREHSRGIYTTYDNNIHFVAQHKQPLFYHTE